MKYILSLFIILIVGCVSIPKDKFSLYYSAPPLMNGVKIDMNTPGYWISKIDNPDEIIMDYETIKLWNAKAEEEFGLIEDISKYERRYTSNELKENINKALYYSEKEPLIFKNGNKPDKDFYQSIRENMNIDSITENYNITYGFVKKYSDIRALPTMELLNYDVGEWDFDVIQYSAADISTPVVILHKSKDKNWLYIENQIVSGWIKSENIINCSHDDLSNYLSNKDFVIITEAKGEIFIDGKYHNFARMGSRFGLNSVNENFVQIKLPFKNDNNTIEFKIAEIPRNQVSIGYLEYTQRNIINTAFKLLNTPYGWGGMFGEQDCSRLILQVFRTSGLLLPRHSIKQSQIGKLIHLENFQESLKEENIIKNAIPGISILQYPGHIMLYLGEDNDKAFAIHSTWAYREHIQKKDKIRLVNRTIISNFSLGEGTKKGSIISRLKVCSIYDNDFSDRK